MKEKNVALVTEAGNNLGMEFVNILLAQGYEVILAACGESFKKLSQSEQDSAAYELVETDFTSAASISKLEEKVSFTFGKLDLLINNAEIANGFGHKIDQLCMEDVKKVYEINVFAVMRTIQLLKPLLLKSESPKIINITSALGDVNKMTDDNFCYSSYGLIAYSTSKAALNMFTQLQCKEFRPSKIDIYSFDPVAIKNCTYNSVTISEDIKNEFIALLKKTLA